MLSGRLCGYGVLGVSLAALIVACGSSGPSQSEVEACAKRDIGYMALGDQFFSTRGGYREMCRNYFAVESVSVADQRIAGDRATVDAIVKVKSTGRTPSGGLPYAFASCFTENMMTDGKMQKKITVVLSKWESGWRCGG